MKICKIFIGPVMLYILSAAAASQAQESLNIAFLQEIQGRLTQVSGLKDRGVRLHITPDQKRIIHATATSVSYSYGFLKHMKNINQMIAVMAHMTAHISLDYIERPPLPEDQSAEQKSALKDYVTATVRPEYPDENYMPQATGAFHDKGAVMPERPGYQNRNYDYAVNKKSIIKAEHEREADRVALKILKHGGFCPADYGHMLRYFYEHPQKLLGNDHFALEADQWPRLDRLDRLSSPGQSCSESQNALAQKYASAFDQLKVKIMQALKAHR